MSARLMIGDVRQRIKDIPDGSVDLICTSPPFLALRKYGDNPEGEMGSEATPAEFIDGLLSLTAEFRRVLAPHGSIAVELGDTFSGSGGAGGDYNEDGLRAGQAKFDGSARRAKKRTDGGRYNGYSGYATGLDTAGSDGGFTERPPNGGPGWPLAKSLCLTPFAYPMALAYGRNPLTGQASPAGQWMVRNMIARARPNPPVGDPADKVRPGTSYITVATTSPRRWFDLDAVRTPLTEPDRVQRRIKGSSREDGWMRPEDDIVQNAAGAPPLDWWDDDYDPADPVDAYTLGHMTLIQATQPYKGAHYATWPKALAQRLILMMCPPKVCTVCGVPSERIVEYGDLVSQGSRFDAATWDPKKAKQDPANTSAWTIQARAGFIPNHVREATALGWTHCGCGDGCRPTTWERRLAPVLLDDGTPELTKAGKPKMKKQRVVGDIGRCVDPSHWRPGLVLDPFVGSGTTMQVATGNGRDAIGVELYEENAHLVRERVGMFIEEVA